MKPKSKLNKFVTPIIAIVLGYSSLATAQSSREYAEMGVAMWAGFECATFANVFEDKAEVERLFSFAYEQGKAFIAVMQAGKIDKQDVSSIVPSGVLMGLGGPTPDFMLGKIYTGAAEHAHEDMFAVNGELTTKEYQVMLAKSRYAKSNCALVGHK